MNTIKSILIEATTLIKLCFLFLNCYFLPFYFGIPLYLLGLRIYYKSMEKLFGLIELNTLDNTFLKHNYGEQYVGITMMEVPKGKIDKMVDFYINDLAKFYPKFRSYLKLWMGEYWWKPLDFESFKKKFIIRRYKTLEFTDIKGMTKWTSIDLKTNIDIFNGNVPLELIVFEHPDNHPVVGLKFHHVFSDGMGFISSFFTCAKNYSKDIFYILQNKMYICILRNFLIFL